MCLSPFSRLTFEPSKWEIGKENDLRLHGESLSLAFAFCFCPLRNRLEPRSAIKTVVISDLSYIGVWALNSYTIKSRLALVEVLIFLRV